MPTRKTYYYAIRGMSSPTSAYRDAPLDRTKAHYVYIAVPCREVSDVKDLKINSVGFARIAVRGVDLRLISESKFKSKIRKFRRRVK